MILSQNDVKFMLSQNKSKKDTVEEINQMH